MAEWLADRFGYRGAWLMLLGAVWMIFAVGVALEPNQPRPWVLYELVPTWLQSLGWATSGAVAIWQGSRGPDAHDWRGHVALYVMPAVRLISFALSWALWLASTALAHAGVGEHVIGWASGWYAALVWLVISLMLRLVAGWPNPDRPIPHPPTSSNGGS